MPAILTLKLDRILFRRLSNGARAFDKMASWQTSRRLKDLKTEAIKQQDIFERLEEAREPTTGLGLTASDLNAEAIGLIVAGTLDIPFV